MFRISLLLQSKSFIEHKNSLYQLKSRIKLSVHQGILSVVIMVDKLVPSFIPNNPVL